MFGASAGAVFCQVDKYKFHFLLCYRLDSLSYKQRDELSVSSIDDVLLILKSDYENAYFVTGITGILLHFLFCLFPLLDK